MSILEPQNTNICIACLLLLFCGSKYSLLNLLKYSPIYDLNKDLCPNTEKEHICVSASSFEMKELTAYVLCLLLKICHLQRRPFELIHKSTLSFKIRLRRGYGLSALFDHTYWPDFYSNSHNNPERCLQHSLFFARSKVAKLP